MVVLPEPDKPVSQMHWARCNFSADLASLLISSACQWTLLARRKAKFNMPAPTVSNVNLSIKMKLPITRLLR